MNKVKEKNIFIADNQDVDITCPRCYQPAKLHTPPGFGQAPKIICNNPACPSLKISNGWGN